MKTAFRRFANWSADRLGSPYAFIIGMALVVLWAITGPIFHYSDAWQLVVNTATNILTFVMVFLIQNTQNRDTKAMQLKLDELLRAVGEARTQLVDLEDAPEEVMAALKEQFQELKEAHPPLVENLAGMDASPEDDRSITNGVAPVPFFDPILQLNIGQAANGDGPEERADHSPENGANRNGAEPVATNR